MKVEVAASAGFCFGVKRAVDTVYEELGKGNPIYTYGPIIHNEEVVGDLERKGVRVIENEEGLNDITEGVLIIRSHGVSKRIYQLLRDKGIAYVDATCPFVRRIHRTVEQAGREGKKVVIIGNDGHPEVEGIRGWCQGEAAVIGSRQEAEAYVCGETDKLCVVSQTTFNYNKFQELVEIFQERGYNVNVVNTICSATEERQTEAKEIASRADIMIVIGGTHSSNTRKLYEICSKECDNTYFIQTLKDLHLGLPKTAGLVGITAGASTPNNIIEEVQNYVRINF